MYIHRAYIEVPGRLEHAAAAKINARLHVRMCVCRPPSLASLCDLFSAFFVQYVLQYEQHRGTVQILSGHR